MASVMTVRESPRVADSLRSPMEDGRTCCLCGGEQFKLIDSWEAEHPRNSATIPLGVWECTCGLAALHPVPTQHELPAAGDWWTTSKKLVRRRLKFKRFRNKVQDHIFGDAVTRFAKYTMKARSGGRLLDVGCGIGGLLDRFKDHFECVGLEPSPVAAAEIRKKGYEVIESMLEDADLADNSFDVVTMDAVIEHVYDPIDALRQIHRCLKPGGVVALKTPKFRGLSNRLHKRDWNGYRVGYHTFLFTGKSLGACMKAAGFQVLSSPIRDRPLDDILILWGRK